MIILSKAKLSELPDLGGTLIALDWGLKRIGWATADSQGIAITPRGHLKREKIKGKNPWVLLPHDVEVLKELKKHWEAEHWILGWPVNKGGIETDTSRNSLKLAQELEHSLGGEMILVDETLTSWDQKGVADVDAGAAATLLEDFFEQRKRIQKRGSVQWAFAALLVVLLVLAGAFGKFYYDFAFKSAGNADPSLPPSVILDVKPGSNFQAVKKDLENQLGFHVNTFVFKAWSHFVLKDKKLRIGEYRINRAWSAKQIFDEILSGSPLLYKVVVKEGYNMWDILAAFRESHENQDPTQLSKLFYDTRLLSQFDFLKAQTNQPRSLEGFLFPETYSYQKYDSPKKLVESMLEQFKRRALPILEQHPWAKVPGGLYRLLILASIVEKESGQRDEQVKIASVFWNRIAKRMKLQSDPTTIYGLLPQFDGNLTKTHLLTPTPWNTYTIPELPLTPISNPGETALMAVVHPEQTDYLYFVAKGNGYHEFSSDYKTHEAFVDQYQRKHRDGKEVDAGSPAETQRHNADSAAAKKAAASKNKSGGAVAPKTQRDSAIKSKPKQTAPKAQGSI